MNFRTKSTTLPPLNGRFCTVLLLCLLIARPGWADNGSGLNLPDLGDTTSGIVSHRQEKEMGRAWLRLYRNRVPHYIDPQLQHYLEELVGHLAHHSALLDKSLQLILVDNADINAFAAPGGIIGVHTGLLLMARSEDEVASVLAHELAHLSQRHWVRSVEAQRNNAIPTMAGLLASLVLMATSQGTAGMAALSATQAANLQTMLRFSRQYEKEADNIGMNTLVRAGFNPAGMTAMFEHMLDSHRFQGRRPPEYLLSHPVTERRVADSRARQNQYPPTTSRQSNRYHLMRARVQLHHSETPQEAIKRFKSEVDGASLNKDASRYGLALAYIKAHQFDQAAQLLKQLQEKQPEEIILRMTLARLAYEQGQLDSAEKQLLAIKQSSYQYYPADMLLAKVYSRGGQNQKAEKILHILSQQRKEDPHVWYELAEIRGLAGNISGVHLARTEYFMLHGIYDQARTQLKYALHLLKDNHVESERIKQRLREIDKLEQISLKI